ncbi:MAG TPA: glycine zipper 2TM domain-containing protein [Allosphingosinicella sp.]|nr:glycine zipper 2TM domain-containing protein [Allosphingosinicella sp.]
MKSFARFALIALASASALPGPALAQTRADEARFDAAQARFERELRIYQQEVDRYRSARGWRGSYNDRGGYDDDRYENGYDPARYYREGTGYQERVLASDDRVYRGSDGRYYCKRSDGTTGLIVGAAAGGVLGNVIDGGHSRTAGTLIGAAIGALAGRSIDQSSSSEIRCR